MDKRIYSCLVITFIIKTAVATSCTIRNDDNCYYTVNCDIPAKINIVPQCGNNDLYITLVINESPVRNVTANFFNAKFNSYVRILTAIGNSWDAIQNYAFSNFKNVVYMDLSENQIKSLGEAFIGLEQLDSLNLSRNHLDQIKTEVFNLTLNKNRLSLLDLSYNLLTYLLDDFFVNMYNLRQLYLQGNKLTILGDQSSANLKNFNYLNLCCSNFTTLNITLKHFSNLKVLDLSLNQFKNIDELEVESLETIILSHNIFEEVMLDNFDQFPLLERLDLSYNKLKKMPSSNSPQNPNGTKPLIKIYLNNNNISHIDETFFMNVNYIQVLNLSYNEIKEIKKDTFKYAKILRVLSVSNCGLKLTNETFMGLDHTQVIEISRNNLSSINATFFSQCRELELIEADFNNITTVDSEMFQKLVPSLTRITLRYNPIALMMSLEPTEFPSTTIESIKISLLMQKAVDSIDLITAIYCTILIILFLIFGALLLLMFVPMCPSKNDISYSLKVKNV